MRQGGVGEEPEYRRKQQEAGERQRRAQQQEDVIHTIVSIRASIDSMTAEHSATRKQAHAHEYGKRKRELSTFWALVAAASAAILTLIVSHCDNRDIINQTANDTAAIITESQRVSNRQHSDTLAALEQTRQQVTAAEKQAAAALAQATEATKQTKIAQDGFIASNRPWIEADELKILQVQIGLGDQKDAILAIVNFTYKNIGHSLARGVWVNARLLTDIPTVWTYREHDVCETQGIDNPLGSTLFPNAISNASPFSQPQSALGNIWKAGIANIESTKAIAIFAPICISYRFAGSDTLHGTSIVYQISAKYHCTQNGKTKSCGNMFETGKLLFKEDEIEKTPMMETIRAN